MISSISFRKITLPKDKNIFSVDYQISNNGKFELNDIIINIEQDIENLTGREFDLDYTVHDIYYGRVKINFNAEGTSYWGWSKPIVLTKKGDGYSHNNSVIVTPKLNITSDLNNCDLGGFTVNGSEFVLFTGAGNHGYSNWYIKDMSNNILWQREDDKRNLTSIRIPNNTLDINRHYILEAIYFSNGNQRSNTGRLIIKTTGKSPLAEIIEFNNPRPTSEDYEELKKEYYKLVNLVVNDKILN